VDCVDVTKLAAWIGRMVSRVVSPCAVLLASLVGVPVMAQEPLTVESAVHAALARNAALRAARASLDEAAARVGEVRAGFFPRLSLTESWQRGDQPVFVFSSLLSARRFAAENFAIDALNHPDPIGFFRLGLGVDQLVFDGGRQRALTTAASLRQTIAGASADEVAGELMVSTVETFGRVVNGEAARRAAEAGVASAREDHARAQRRRDAGLATEADVLSLAVHVAELQQRAIQADSDAARARAELNRLMGAPIDQSLQVMVPVVAAQSVDEDVKSLIAQAEAARPELRRIAASEGVAAVARQQARSALIPHISAQAAVDVAGTEIADRASSWIVGAEMRWTFSTGGAELAGMTAAAASVTRARAEAEDVRARVQVEIVTALRRVQAARARTAVARAAVEQARESQRIIRDRFEAGVAPVNDVLRASTAMLEAEANTTSAVVDMMVADAMLRRAVGRVP
jgi:outer membrane protein TolC